MAGYCENHLDPEVQVKQKSLHERFSGGERFRHLLLSMEGAAG